MIRQIIVRDVIERHNCAGIKTIEVTAMANDELTPSRFRLTRAYMLPHEKLHLATVSPMDEITIVVDDFVNNPLILGEYIRGDANLDNRVPLCRCGTLLVSDGFDIACPNLDCGLTLLTRIERLANTTFFSFNSLVNNVDLQDSWFETEELKESYLFSGDPNFERPFLPLLDIRLWGESIGSLELILLKKRRMSLSLANFLVEDLFRDFLECVNPLIDPGSNMFNGIRTFYGSLTEAVMRRQYDSPEQDQLIKEFIWSLGIESLRPDVIEAMVFKEKEMGCSYDVMIPYAYMLSHPMELVRETGIHPIEASVIASEFYRRRHEFSDIFLGYSTPESMRDVFRNLRH